MALMGCVIQSISSKARSKSGRVVVRLLLVFAITLPWLARGSVDAKLAVGDYEIIGEVLYATDMDEWSRASRLMTQIEDPLASKLFHWFTLVEDKREASFDELAVFVLENPTWPRIDEIQAMAESRLTDSADQALTLQLFAEREPLTTRGRIRLAEAQLNAGRKEEAVQQIKWSWTRGQFTGKEEKSFLERHGRHLNQYDHDIRLENMLWERQWQAAKRMYPRVSKDHQKLARARIALQQQSGGVDQAIAGVPAAFQKDPGLSYDRIRWRRLKKKHDDAVALLLDPPPQLGRPERWWYERSFQIRRAIDRRDFKTAYDLAQHHGQLTGGDYAEAEWLAGWLALRFNKRAKTAFRHFVRLYDRVRPPVRQSRAAYWAGRAALAQGDDAGAIAWYRRAASHHLTYYGQLAAGELEERTLIRKPLLPTKTERVTFDDNEVARVARMLIAAGAVNHLDDFLLTLSENAETAAEISMITELAVAGGRPSLLATLGRKAAFDGKVYAPAAFPVPRIEGLLNPVTDTVEPPLLLGLARQESMFRSGAASGAGARGLLQLLPSTARIVAKKVGEKYDSDRLIGDPNYNALLGEHYFASMLERFDDERALALAAYNAGPLRVKQWIERHGDPRTRDDHAVVDWIELIPFSETRNYVQRVLEGFHAYKQRLASPDLALVDYASRNGLHPQRLPMPKPRDGTASLAGPVREARSSEPLHRPLFKPVEVGSLPSTETFDDQGTQRLAADEGEIREIIVPSTE